VELRAGHGTRDTEGWRLSRRSERREVGVEAPGRQAAAGDHRRVHWGWATPRQPSARQELGGGRPMGARASAESAIAHRSQPGTKTDSETARQLYLLFFFNL
jgi:hypothetical protein